MTLKQGDTFAVFSRAGDIEPRPDSPEGVYHRDTRHLSQFSLTMSGARPMLLSATLRDDNVLLTCDLTNPDLPQAQGHVENDRIHIRRSRFLWNGACMERIAARNFDRRPLTLEFEIAFAADFADLFEVRGARRERRGVLRAPEVDAASVRMSYDGLDEQRRETLIRFDPPPTQLTSGRAKYVMQLDPGEWRSIFVEVICGPQGPEAGQRAFLTALRDSKRALYRAASRAAKISSSNESFNEATSRSVADLYMLLTDTPQGPYPYAGVPWFSTAFGRDALITAWETLWLDPAIAGGVLGHLAALQATTTDPQADAEPGKILHEARNGEMAILGEVPFRRYYGSVDSTPLFVALAGAYFDRTGDLVDGRAAVAEHRSGAGLDGPLRRPRRRRLHRIWPPVQRRPRQSGLEGQPRFRVPRRRRARARADRHRRGAGLRLCRLARRRAHRAPPGQGGRSRALRRARADRCAAASTKPSSTRSSGPTCSRSTATRSRAASRPPTPATRCSPASPIPSAPARWLARSPAAPRSAAGACARWPRAKCATTR